jgi:hypothetical protein
VFEPLGHRSLSVYLPPIAIVIVALQALCTQPEPLPHDKQKPLERLHGGRNLVSLKPRDPRLTGAGTQSEAPLGKPVTAPGVAD